MMASTHLRSDSVLEVRCDDDCPQWCDLRLTVVVRCRYASLLQHCSTRQRAELRLSQSVQSDRCSCISSLQPELLQRPGSVQTPQLPAAVTQLSPSCHPRCSHSCCMQKPRHSPPPHYQAASYTEYQHHNTITEDVTMSRITALMAQKTAKRKL